MSMSASTGGFGMKDTMPRLGRFGPYFAEGALSRLADSQTAAHGAEMDAPEILPAGAWENNSTCLAYPQPRAAVVGR